MAQKTKEKTEPKTPPKEPESKEKRRGPGRPPERKPQLKDETRHTVIGVIFLALALFFIIAGFGHGGIAGHATKSLLGMLFGVGYALAPLLLGSVGITFMRSGKPEIAVTQAIGSALFLIGSLGLIDVATSTAHSAGFLGRIVAYPFVALFDTLAATLFLGAALIISIVILFDTRPTMTIFAGAWASIQKFFAGLFTSKKETGEITLSGMTSADEVSHTEVAPPTTPEPEPIPEQKAVPIETTDEADIAPIAKTKKKRSNYIAPLLEMLESDRGKPNTGDVKANANIIKRTLANFGIEVEMDEVTIGPTVTRYAFKPAEGVKLSRILALQNDLALALAAHPLRIEAPIPGKSLVGIEVPNKGKSIIGLGSLLSDAKFQKSEDPLTVALGRSIEGAAHFANLAKMPHVLVAGTTGSGKSVTIHSIITSLLYRNGPDDLRFILIDPKRVELTLYNKIPHLLTPVITDPKKAILALKWAAKEMDRRYNILESESVRDIKSYHRNIVAAAGKRGEGEAAPDPMPYIVIMIDELADIMQTYPRELEAAIVRLAQMSRAVGIHLLLSTQRPSVNVITGLIKANIPARVALAVSSQIDSRTILDQGGAEKLLGAGDMLYLSSDFPNPTRLQSAFISENEVKSVVKWIADNNEEIIGEDIALVGTTTADKSIFEASLEDKSDEDDELYEDARATVIDAGKASTSFLQRKLGIGYARAARLIDILEERGVIGPGSGAKPRDVLIKPGDGIMDEPV